MDIYRILMSCIILSSLLWIVWCCVRRCRLEEPLPEKAVNSHDEAIALIVAACCSVIEKSLASLPGNDVVSACRIYRAGLTSLKKLEQQTASRCKAWKQNRNFRIYQSYMTETSGQIVEMCRMIASTPGYRITIPDKCEIETLRNEILSLIELAGDLSHPETVALRIARKVEMLNDIIDHFKTVHFNDMTLDDFDDRSYKHSYLRLLSYLHSFLISSRQLIKVAGNGYEKMPYEKI